MAEALVKGQRVFAAHLAAETRLDPRVIGAWLKSEQSGSAARNYQGKRYFNWLNIARTDSGDAGGSHAGVWGNPVSAAKATAEWIRGEGPIARQYGKPAPGIRAILNAAGKSPQQQIAAIGRSGWATAPDYGAKIGTLFGELAGDHSLLHEAHRASNTPQVDEHAAEAGQLAQAVAPAGPSPAQNADLLQLLQSSLAPQQGASVAGTPLPRPQSSGGAYQSPTAPRVPSALTPKPAASNQDAILGLVAKLGQEAAPAAAQEHAAEAPVKAASPQAQSKLAQIVAEANHIEKAHVPYLRGGGHSGKVLAGGKVTPLDCSGAVSAALGINPKVSGEFESWGAPGPGKNVSIYANKDHVLLSVNGRFWGTSSSNPGGGAGWIKPGVISKSYLRNFTVRHPGKL